MQVISAGIADIYPDKAQDDSKVEDTKDALGSMLRRIDQRLKRMQSTDRAASIAAGLSPDQIRSMRRQYKAGTQHGASIRTIAQLAVALRTSPEWLMSGIGPGTRACRRSATLPTLTRQPIMSTKSVLPRSGLGVAGVVAAGQWLEPGVSTVEPKQTRVPADPRYLAHRQRAYEVHGTAIDRVARTTATFSSWSIAVPHASNTAIRRSGHRDPHQRGSARGDGAAGCR